MFVVVVAVVVAVVCGDLRLRDLAINEICVHFEQP